VIRLQLLGGPAVVGPGIAPDAATRLRRAIALLALVASAAPKAVARDRLLAFLWPESDTERARNSLRQTLFALRRDLGEEVFSDETPAGLQLDPAHVTVDLWDFTAALKEGTLEKAVAAYHGPFLDSFHIAGLEEFAEWVELERDRLKRQYIDALDALALGAEQEGRVDEAVAWRRRQSEVDALSSRVALALLQALVAAGDRTGALTHAASYERLVRTRLEVEPDASVSAFVDELRTNVDVPEPPPRLPTPVASHIAIARSASPASIAAIASSTTRATPSAAREVAPVRRRPAWVVPTMAAAAVGIAVTIWFTTADEREASAGGPLRFGSAMVIKDGRDMENMMVACEGPSCPDSLPVPAFAVAKHDSYANPSPGTGYIAWTPDAVSIKSPGHRCCTTATFEREFRAPAGAISATLSVLVHADNRAFLRINGLEFGRQADSLSQDNFVGEPDVFTTTFLPRPGVNKLQVVLWDLAGAAAITYSAQVSFLMPRDTVGRGGAISPPK
jgi:DNA-binding SARP family transcriptional activator